MNNCNAGDMFPVNQHKLMIAMSAPGTERMVSMIFRTAVSEERKLASQAQKQSVGSSIKVNGSFCRDTYMRSSI
ncbi:hypothetical protein BZK41_09125 [Citrobacter sp. A316]|nr:hypothetical protein BZK41_09125 [Citrobacter sp. A316]